MPILIHRIIHQRTDGPLKVKLNSSWNMTIHLSLCEHPLADIKNNQGKFITFRWYYTCSWNPRMFAFNNLIHNDKWHMEIYSKTVLKYFDYIQKYICRKDNICHQYVFQPSILLCGKNYLKFPSEYLCLGIWNSLIDCILLH